MSLYKEPILHAETYGLLLLLQWNFFSGKEKKKGETWRERERERERERDREGERLTKWWKEREKKMLVNGIGSKDIIRVRNST